MITLEQAIKLATQAHKDQWLKPSTVMSDKWDHYKQQTEVICGNGNKIVWCNGNTFLVYEPYIIHPLSVMNMMDTNEEKIVAILHDVIEDTEWNLFPFDGLWIQHSKNKQNRILILESIYSALHKLTKWKTDNKTYKAYIKDIALSKVATKVKIADIVHNLSCSPTDHAKEKYLKAMPVLLKSL